MSLRIPSISELPRCSFNGGLALLLWAWFATVLALNLPGHLTHDSITQIAEGRTGFVRSWNPVFSSWVFGTLVDWTGGIELLVAASASMLAAAIYLAGRASPHPQSALALIPAAILLFMPIPLIHPGVIWKDVWFAHFALLGFGLICVRAQGAGVWVEGLALTVLAAALLSRQTGVLVSGFGVVALALAAPEPRIAHGIRSHLTRLALGTVVRMIALGVIASVLSAWAKSEMKQIQIGEVGTGFKLVAMFDMAGMLQRNPNLHLNVFQDEGYGTAAWEEGAKATFSPERIDYLELRPITGPRDVSSTLVLKQWLSLITANPTTYIMHRLEVYSWFSGMRNQTKCIPIHVGVDRGPLTPDAGIKLQAARQAPSLYQWSRKFVDTPYFAPLFWNGISLLVACVLIARCRWREPILWLQISGLAYSASYLIAGFSCDFRYSYFSVLAATIGAIRLFAGDWRSTLKPTASQNV